MAKDLFCHSLNSIVIKKFIEDIEKVIDSSPFVLSSDIQKHFGPTGNTIYLRGRLFIIDSSILEIAIFASKSRNAISIDKYRFHYIDKQGSMMFRYDNAPHHQKMSSFPHHKHLSEKITSATMPSLRDVLNEISAIIIGHKK